MPSSTDVPPEAGRRISLGLRRCPVQIRRRRPETNLRDDPARPSWSRLARPHDTGLSVVNPSSDVIPPGSVVPFQEAATTSVEELLRYRGDQGVAPFRQNGPTSCAQQYRTT
jgi:hypothetical protein